jgi:hypothetical protein
MTAVRSRKRRRFTLVSRVVQWRTTAWVAALAVIVVRTWGQGPRSPQTSCPDRRGRHAPVAAGATGVGSGDHDAEEEETEQHHTETPATAHDHVP